MRQSVTRIALLGIILACALACRPRPARACPTPIVVQLLERELGATGWTVLSDKVWTTDAPYRETKTQVERWAAEDILAVEMQVAPLFAFGTAWACLSRP